jgi:S-adenosylmethionine hydrolase
LAFVPNSIITLTTDFGRDDPFVGTMKGVILSVNSNARIVDITHGVPAHDILAGAMALQSSCSYFPEGTVHVAVVDPGVGSSRRPLLAVSNRYAFVGPDNGLLSPLIQSQKGVQVFHLTEEAFFLKPVSQTFHGRDIFAPVAAWLSRGKVPDSFGKPIEDWIRLDWPSPQRSGEILRGTVLRIDHFGNLITNISPQDLSSQGKLGHALEILIGKHTIRRVCASYAEATAGEPFAIMGSAGLLEISVRQASAAALLGIRPQQEFEVRFL